MRASQRISSDEGNAMFKYKVRPAGVADFTAVYKMNERILGSKVSKKEAERVYRNTLILITI